MRFHTVRAAKVKISARRAAAGFLLLVLGSPAAQRKAALDAIADVLLRVAALLDAHAEEIASIELRPLALLLGGNVEVREARFGIRRRSPRPRGLGRRHARGAAVVCVSHAKFL